MDRDTRTTEARAADERAISALHRQTLDASGAGNGKGSRLGVADEYLKEEASP
jgi:hypothetical protein